MQIRKIGTYICTGSDSGADDPEENWGEQQLDNSLGQTSDLSLKGTYQKMLMKSVMNFWYFPYVNHTSVLNSYIANILLSLSIITPEQTFEVRVQLILGFSEEVSAHIFHASLPLHLLFWTNSSLPPKLMWRWFGSLVTQFPLGRWMNIYMLDRYAV